MTTSFKIETFPFSYNWAKQLIWHEKWMDRPVVYLINNEKSIYIWETSSALSRFSQHLVSTEKKWLQWMNIVFDDTFNKSAILDIEQNLIQYFWADKKYKILNKNWWQSAKHNYYQREYYINKFDLIREELKRLWLVNKGAVDIRNSDLFKYSPYNTLTDEQDIVSRKIIYDMIEKLEKKEDWTAIINWWAWTGKTIVLINMIYKLINANNIDFDKAIDDPDLSDYIQFIHNIKEFVHNYKWKKWDLKVAYISPMVSLRQTLKEVFKNTWNWLKSSLVVGPLDIVDDFVKTKVKYDIVFVDEAHRLAKHKNIWFMWAFNNAAKKFWLNPDESNLLDFIVKCSKYRVLVYDKWQSIKWSDITEQELHKSLQESSVSEFKLTSQLRCKWWKDYLEYINNIFDCSQTKKDSINNYDFKIFDDVKSMTTKIENLDKEYSLCRNVAWYSRKRISKWLKNIEEIKQNHKEDINIEWNKYIRNMTNEKWIWSNNSLETIWCVHTTQWYDLNYVWIIFWNEIDYDKATNIITINKNEFYDTNVKKGVSDEELKQYIINSYKVMMTRWIRWCYVYACNKWLREYLSKFIDKA